MLFGVGIGVMAVTALSLRSRDQDHGSAYSAGTSGTVGTASGAARQEGGSDRRGGPTSRLALRPCGGARAGVSHAHAAYEPVF
jgi:hypothetical protein